MSESKTPCKHGAITTWMTDDGMPTMWSCVTCNHKFVPISQLMQAEAERDALAARVEKAEAQVRVLPEPVGYISTGTYYWLVRGKADPASIYGTGSISARKTDKYDNPVYMEPNDAALSREEPSVTHGVNCSKAPHKIAGGYLHREDDDSPYDVDGVAYCGRCHTVMP